MNNRSTRSKIELNNILAADVNCAWEKMFYIYDTICKQLFRDIKSVAWFLPFFTFIFYTLFYLPQICRNELRCLTYWVDDMFALYSAGKVKSAVVWVLNQIRIHFTSMQPNLKQSEICHPAWQTRLKLNEALVVCYLKGWL